MDQCPFFWEQFSITKFDYMQTYKSDSSEQDLLTEQHSEDIATLSFEAHISFVPFLILKAHFADSFDT